MSLVYFNTFVKDFELLNKSENTQHTICQYLNRCMQIFDYDGLPESIPKDILELYLLTSGKCAIVDNDGDLYAVRGEYSDIPNAYYIPQKFVVANPYLKTDKNYVIGKDCVVAKNDSLAVGLGRTIAKYASLLTDNELTLNRISTMLRAVCMIDTPDDDTKKAADIYLKDLENGKLSALADKDFLDKIQVFPFSSHAGTLSECIEYQQFLNAKLWSDLGIAMNYNMKRESLTSNEVSLDHNALLPLIDNMLECRQKMCEEVNAMYGVDWKVDLKGAWKDVQKEVISDTVDEDLVDEKRESDV